ncbi:MAG: hypothetical protein O3B95_05385 [Chloroflexi bacterium]|nr:hypothetical protein [Chloroflexota bacterium]
MSIKYLVLSGKREQSLRRLDSTSTALNPAISTLTVEAKITSSKEIETGKDQTTVKATPTAQIASEN